jgi:tripartite-type tricarboxylate transporter receptor subunit TctC
VIEAGVPDYEVTTFNGVAAPAGTPDAIIARLNATINEGLSAPDMQASITKLGAIAMPGTAAEFAAFIAAQGRKWAAVAKAANIRID